MWQNYSTFCSLFLSLIRIMKSRLSAQLQPKSAKYAFEKRELTGNRHLFFSLKLCLDNT